MLHPAVDDNRSSLIPSNIQKDRLDRLTELGERRIGRMLYGRAGEPAQDRLGIGSAAPERCSVFDYLIILPLDQLPVDRTCQHRREIAEQVTQACVRQIEFLPRDCLQARRELEVQQIAVAA
jgi:hypothetical protein